MEQLHNHLQAGRAGGLEIHDPGILTFAALRVTGPAGSVLVSAALHETGVVFYAPPVDGVPYSGVCEVIGTPARITEVAGILLRRVTVAP